MIRGSNSRWARGIGCLATFGCLATLAVLVLAGCGGSSSSATAGRLESLRNLGVNIAISNELPYAQLKPGGKPSGIDPDLAVAALAKEGITKIKANVTDYSAMIPGLQAGQWDMVSAGLQVYPERCKQVLFSDPTIADVEVEVVKEGNPKNIQGYESIASDSSIKFAVMRGTTYDTESRERGVKQSQMVSVPDTLSGIEAVQSGRADVHTLLKQAAVSLQQRGVLKGLEILPVPGAKPQISAVAFKKTDRALRDAFNKGLAAIKKDGTFDEITSKYGFDPKLSRSVTLADAGPDCGR
jgi:polar amino acid transport system substrate-binding protein